MFLDIKKTFESMANMIKERDKLERDIASAEKGPKDLRGYDMDGMPKVEANRPGAENTLNALQKAVEDKLELEKKLAFLSGELRPLIEAMPHEHRRILSARYLDCLSVANAAVAIPYSRTTLYDAIKAAENALLEKLTT